MSNKIEHAWKNPMGRDWLVKEFEDGAAVAYEDGTIYLTGDCAREIVRLVKKNTVKDKRIAELQKINAAIEALIGKVNIKTTNKQALHYLNTAKYYVNCANRHGEYDD